MHIDFFKNLAEKENGKFYFSDGNMSFTDGSRIPDVTYQVKFVYKGNKFELNNRTGVSFEAQCYCNLNDNLKPSEFEIECISHFKKLFLRKQHRLKIKSEDPALHSFIVNNKYFKQLGELGVKEDFSPAISCSKSDAGNWYLTATYHLEFNNYTQVISPLIDFYKSVIDRFGS